ncbi:MAG: preprotein translocase subunit YajC [Oscillospiraceae bacterium]
MGAMLIMMLAVLAIMYFLMIRPENKKKKEAEQMRSAVKVGDKITTIGGIVGVVCSVKDDKIVIDQRRPGSGGVCQMGDFFQRHGQRGRQGCRREGCCSQKTGQGRKESFQRLRNWKTAEAGVSLGGNTGFCYRICLYTRRQETIYVRVCPGWASFEQQGFGKAESARCPQTMHIMILGTVCGGLCRLTCEDMSRWNGPLGIDSTVRHFVLLYGDGAQFSQRHWLWYP